MAELEQEQFAQNLARTYVQHAEDAKRDAIDTIPKVFFNSGVVFLSLVVPLFFTQPNLNTCVVLCFRCSVIAMVISIICSGLMFLRTIRTTSCVIDTLQPIADGERLWMGVNLDRRTFRWWEMLFILLMAFAFISAVVLLTVALFVK